MFGLTTQQLALLAAAVLCLGWGLWEWRGTLTAIPWPSFGGGTKAKPDRKAILGLLDDAHAYFEEAKCKEGMAAIETAVRHVYAEHPHA